MSQKPAKWPLRYQPLSISITLPPRFQNDLPEAQIRSSLILCSSGLPRPDSRTRLLRSFSLAPTTSHLQLHTSPPTTQMLSRVSNSPFPELAHRFWAVNAFEPTMPPTEITPHPSASSTHKLWLIFKSYLRPHLLGKAFASSPGHESLPLLCSEHFHEYSLYCTTLPVTFLVCVSSIFYVPF